MTKAKSEDLCRSGFHPRGEDSFERIGRSTGRSLTGLSHATGKIADRYWCRSDLRYERRFAPQIHTLPYGIIAYPGAPTSGMFTAYGRLGCYYTATGIFSVGGSAARRCGYLFPLPQCTDSGAKRDFSNEEVEAYKDDSSFAAKSDGSTPCAKPLPLCTDSGGTKRSFTKAELDEYKKAPALEPSADGSSPCVKPPQCTTSGGTKRAFTTAELAEFCTAFYAAIFLYGFRVKQIRHS